MSRTSEDSVFSYSLIEPSCSSLSLLGLGEAACTSEEISSSSTSCTSFKSPGLRRPFAMLSSSVSLSFSEHVRSSGTRSLRLLIFTFFSSCSSGEEQAS